MTDVPSPRRLKVEHETGRRSVVVSRTRLVTYKADDSTVGNNVTMNLKMERSESDNSPRGMLEGYSRTGNLHSNSEGMIGRCATTYYGNRSSEFVRQIQAADNATDIVGEECEVFYRCRETGYTGCLRLIVLSFNDKRHVNN